MLRAMANRPKRTGETAKVIHAEGEFSARQAPWWSPALLHPPQTCNYVT